MIEESEELYLAPLFLCVNDYEKFYCILIVN